MSAKQANEHTIYNLSEMARARQQTKTEQKTSRFFFFKHQTIRRERTSWRQRMNLVTRAKTSTVLSRRRDFCHFRPCPLDRNTASHRPAPHLPRPSEFFHNLQLLLEGHVVVLLLLQIPDQSKLTPNEEANR